MDKDYLKEEIKHQRNMKDNLWFSFMATIGTSIVLLLNFENIFKITTAVCGLIFSYILLNGYYNRLTRIENLLLKIKKGE